MNRFKRCPGTWWSLDLITSPQPDHGTLAVDTSGVSRDTTAATQNFSANSRAALSRSWSSTSSPRVAQAGRGKLMRTGAGMSGWCTIIVQDSVLRTDIIDDV